MPNPRRDGAVVDDVVVALPAGPPSRYRGRRHGEPVPGASVIFERDGARSRATPAVPIVGMTDEAGVTGSAALAPAPFWSASSPPRAPLSCCRGAAS